jgi:hypothetical protein
VRTGELERLVSGSIKLHLSRRTHKDLHYPALRRSPTLLDTRTGSLVLLSTPLGRAAPSRGVKPCSVDDGPVSAASWEGEAT